jgi:hypothetical protein
MLIKNEQTYPYWMRSFIHKNYIDLFINLMSLICIVSNYNVLWFVPIAYIISTCLITMMECLGTDDEFYGSSIIAHIILGFGMLCPDNILMTLFFIAFLYKSTTIDNSEYYNIIGLFFGFVLINVTNNMQTVCF